MLGIVGCKWQSSLYLVGPMSLVHCWSVQAVLPTSPFSTVSFGGWSNDLVDPESCPAQVLSGSRDDPLVMRPLTAASSLDRSK